MENVNEGTGASIQALSTLVSWLSLAFVQTQAAAWKVALSASSAYSQLY